MNMRYKQRLPLLSRIISGGIQIIGMAGYEQEKYRQQT